LGLDFLGVGVLILTLSRKSHVNLVILLCKSTKCLVLLTFTVSSVLILVIKFLISPRYTLISPNFSVTLSFFDDGLCIFLDVDGLLSPILNHL